MSRLIEGKLQGHGLRVAILAARFNDLVVERLVAGASAELRRHGVDEQAVTLVRVPGSFELPQAAEALARAGGHDALVALGVLLRGETAHFDLIASEVVGRLSEIGLRHGLPVSLGVLTCDSLEQAFERAGGKLGNKGAEAAAAALELASLLTQLGPSQER